MTSTIIPQSKNTAILTNQQTGSSQNMTWDEASFSWDNAQGTWNNPGPVYASQTKNTATLTNQTKN